MKRARRTQALLGCTVLIASTSIVSRLPDLGSFTITARPVQAQQATDVLQRVQVVALEREAIAHEMRTMLRSLSLILQGLAVGDLEMTEKAARASGKAGALKPELATHLPTHFVELETKVHARFDQIADASKTGGRSDLVKRLAAVTGYCVACHEMYRLEVRR